MSMQEKKLINIKDLVFLVGLSLISTIILMAVMMVAGNIFGPERGYITSFLMPIIPGIIYYLIISKVQKIGAQFVFVCPLAIFLTLTMSPLMASLFLLGIINEIIMLNGGYQSKIRPMIPYILYSVYIAVSGGVMVFIAQDRFLKNTVARLNIPEEEAIRKLDEVRQVYTAGHFTLVAACGVIGAIAGYYLGKKMLYKHFKPAGIVK